MLNLKHLLLAILLVNFTASQSVSSTQLQEKNKTTNESYKLDTIIGISILAALFAFAYMTGRTGHRLLQAQIDQKLTEIRQTEDDNQLTDEKEIAGALKKKQEKENDLMIDTNELHLPSGLSVSYWQMAINKIEKSLGQLYRYRKSPKEEKIKLTQQELYNQFEFEDSI